MPENVPENRCAMVSILRPPETGILAKASRDKIEFDESDPYKCLYDYFSKYNYYFDEWIAAFREQFASVSDELGISCRIREYQIPNGCRIGKKGWEYISSSDVLATLDPPDTLFARIHQWLRKNGGRRALFAFSSESRMDEVLQLLGTTTATIIAAVVSRPDGNLVYTVETLRKKIPRIFACKYRDETTMDHAIEETLKYPKCALIPK